MVEYSVLSKAPIIEALIDIRIKVKEDLSVEQFNSIYDSISGQYPDKKERHKWEGKLGFKRGETPISTSTETIDGYIFTSVDKSQILQTRLDGFTFSRLKPYETWEHLRNEAHGLWRKYKEVTSPEITRVALRYINKMEIPLPIMDFSDYLTAAPTVPDGLPQGVSSFLTRIVIHEPKIDATAIITQAFEQIVNPNILPLILDIDVFKQKSEGISEKETWEILEKLRHFKNEIFFKSITEKAKELFL
ncbi:MAG: TIGR04255 family protein [Nitrospirota bacterium]